MLVPGGRAVFPDMSVDHGLALWERCCRSAVTAAGGFPTVVICHRDLIYDPGRWLPAARAFVSHLGFTPAGGSDVDRIIDRSLHRQQNDGVAEVAVSDRLAPARVDRRGLAARSSRTPPVLLPVLLRAL